MTSSDVEVVALSEIRAGDTIAAYGSRDLIVAVEPEWDGYWFHLQNGRSAFYGDTGAPQKINRVVKP